MSATKILFQLSGSIACFKACQLISRLVQEGFEVQTVCSKNSFEFIGPATLFGLTGRPVITDLYNQSCLPGHIELARWADVAILCPATANTINRLAQGLADDVIGATFLAFNLKAKPYFIAPAMNHEMYHHPAVSASLDKLKSWGVQVLPTGTGYQACGDIAEGRLLEIEKIYSRLTEFMKEIAA